MIKLAPLVVLVFWPQVDLTIPVAVEAAYVIATTQATVSVHKCCGLCAGGKIIHGDGHITDCPCPMTCACKKNPALIHKPIVLPLKCDKCVPNK
jgi:hypothetical protein